MRDIFNCTDIAKYFNPTAFAEPERFLMYVCFEALVSCVATSFVWTKSLMPKVVFTFPAWTVSVWLFLRWLTRCL